MKRILLLVSALLLIGGFAVLCFSDCDGTAEQVTAKHPGPDAPKDGGYDAPNGRWEWEHKRLVNPITGEIPKDMRARELAFAQRLPNDAALAKAAGGAAYDWQLSGPHNVGGRVRAMAIDVSNNDVLLAGGVSGGLWRSDDFGTSWEKVTEPIQHHSITCIAQDTRPGHTDVWYYGSGEVRGNSAGRSFTADYLGNGVYKSTDGGHSWSVLPATSSGTPQDGDAWDLMWGIATDPTVANEDVVYAARQGSIMRSADGGDTWTLVLGESGFNAAYYTEILVTSTGAKYATLSSDGVTKGIFRSENGIDWYQIRPATWPNQYDRVIMAQVPNEDEVYFLAYTPGSGQVTNTDSNSPEEHSLWKYEYVSGTGADSGGVWTDLSMNLPQATENNSTFITQNNYDVCMAIKPDAPNVIWIGGTNLFRSTDGFTSQSNTTQMGGYLPGGSGPWGYRWEGHHPDQHVILFRPDDPDVLVNANDGGIYIAPDCNVDVIPWVDGSLGFVTSQFYTVAIDHGTPGSEVVCGGLQDNGTQWTNSRDFGHDWVSPNLGDGSYCAIEDGAVHQYFSRQYGRIIKTLLDSEGERVRYERIDPEGSSNYLFVHPFILDPTDNNIMYLPEGSHFWRNNDLSGIAMNDNYDKISTNWEEITAWDAASDVTALACSKSNPPHRLYFGSSNRRLWRVDSANVSTSAPVEITSNIAFGGYTSAIAVHPNDGKKVIACYSNYEVVSIYYSEDAGASWTAIGGNLEDEQVQGAPIGLVEGDGPSFRAAAILPVANGTVYLVGTSVGLFATSELDGENTVWTQQGAEVIGNVVVEAIDVRASDGFVAAATHGNGVFTANITSIHGVTGQEESSVATESQLRVFPNPCAETAQLNVRLHSSERLEVYLLDVQGKRVRTVLNEVRPAGEELVQLSLNGLPAGLYFVEVQRGNLRSVERLVKR